MIARHVALKKILENVGPTDLVLATTGMISRELYMLGDRQANFYMIGSMGLLSSFGLGLALLALHQRIFILEGDGSALMSLGSLPLIAAEGPKNLVHIILDNESYESTGGQPSITSTFELARLGESCGYRETVRVDDIVGLETALRGCLSNSCPYLIVIKADIAPVQGIPRVSLSPAEIRDRFRNSVNTQD